MLSVFAKYRSFVGYGLLLAAAVFLLKWLEAKFLIMQHSLEFYSAGIAVVFTVLGVWLAVTLAKPKTETIIIEKEVLRAPAAEPGKLNQNEIERLGLSARELEVLQLMAEGLSNQEIGERLFLSLNTIKTHVSRLFEKMDVKRRTQAIEKAKRLNIIH